MGIMDMRNAVDPGGIVAVLMDEKGDISFEVRLGMPTSEQGVS